MVLHMFICYGFPHESPKTKKPSVQATLHCRVYKHTFWLIRPNVYVTRNKETFVLVEFSASHTNDIYQIYLRFHTDHFKIDVIHQRCSDVTVGDRLDTNGLCTCMCCTFHCSYCTCGQTLFHHTFHFSYCTCVQTLFHHQRTEQVTRQHCVITTRLYDPKYNL